jgi:hypothetical protein
MLQIDCVTVSVSVITDFRSRRENLTDHASFHGERLDRVSAKFDDVPSTPSGSDDSDDVKDDVLGVDAFGQLAAHADAHVLSFALEEGLGCKDVLDL